MCLSFIYTKWYVNRMCATDSLGFILTAWYVNENQNKYISDSLEGFILTTWYVNYDKYESIIFNSCVLY